jgi:hypothetical protein
MGVPYGTLELKLLYIYGTDSWNDTPGMQPGRNAQARNFMQHVEQRYEASGI